MMSPKTFSRVARLLLEHIKEAEERCSAFEHQCDAPDFLASMRGEDRAAAGRWWWREYTSLKDAIKSLIDGKIRHEYDRKKAVRTPNHEGIDWQKASLRTGESLDNLRRLLTSAKSKHEDEFDALNGRIEDLQETIKRIREFFVNKVRGSQVNKFGEEKQELCLKPLGKWQELRLLPPCGYGLEECACGASSSPPKSVHDGSLSEAIEATAREASSSAAAAAAAAAAAEEAAAAAAAGGVPRGKRANDSKNHNDDHHLGGSAAIAEREAKRRRVPNDGPGSDGKSDSDRERAGQRGRRASASASDVPLDEIRRRTGKSPLELERRRDDCEEETRAASGGSSSGDRAGGGIMGKAKAAQEGRGRGQELHGRGDSGSADDKGPTGSGDEQQQQREEEEEDWRDDLMGMQPHERAEAYEDGGMFREALKWHREDLAAARARALDGEEEDERESSLDLARALRNTGRCLGRLGNSGFAESKNYLTEACELVGPDGPSPSPAEEHDVVLELGNLWYNRYLVCDGKGVPFLADEALAAALRCYKESRELCVDLVADGSEGVVGARGSTPTEAAAAAAGYTGARGGLLRAEYNVGMTLFEQDKPADAARHLSSAVSIFRDTFAGTGRRTDNTQQARGSGGVEEGGGATAAPRTSGADVEASTMAAWKAAGRKQEELAGLGGVYASSLFLLAECLASPRGLYSSRSAGALPGKEKDGLPRVAETLEASAGAFLSVEDPARALDPLLKLVETLRQSADDGGDEHCSLSRATALCERAASGLGRPAEHAAGEDERLQLDEIRNGIDGLRARWGAGDDGSGDEAPQDVADRSERGRQGVAGTSEGQEGGSAGVEDGNTASRPTDVMASFGRVGPAPTSGFAERRRRLRAAATAATNVRGGGARNATSRKSIAPDGSRRTTTTEELPATTPVTYGGGAGAGREEWLARKTEGSFAGLRAAVADGEGAAAVVVATAGGTEWRATGENENGRKAAALFSSYREKCRDLQEKPNPLVLARLALADRESAAFAAAAAAAAAASSAAASDDADADTDTGNVRKLPFSREQTRHRTLDLGACRLTHRELRVLVHVLFEDRVGDKPTTGAAVAAAGSAGPVRFSALLLGGNPGIGAGALGGGSSSGGSCSISNSGSQRGLFSLLVRLDLSRCGLTAADLAGFSPTNGDGDGGVVSGSHQVSAEAVCLRALVLRDNPLTRARKRRGGMGVGHGEQHWTEAARKGLDALRDLIARAPALEILDVSGCSQIPDGPAGRLYSPEVSELFASALSGGLEARIVGKAAADASHTGYNGNVSGGSGEGDGRAQVSALRIGNNRFSSPSWRRILEHLASNPPREVDLSSGSVLLPRSSTAAVAFDAAESSTAGRQNRSSPAVAVAVAVAAESDVAPSAEPPGSLEGPAPPEQSLGELLAATVLPADAPGIEILNLTGSTGLLLQQHGEAGGGGASEDGGHRTHPSLCASTAAFLMLLRDALVSPLCRATHLLLSGVRGSPLPPENTTASEDDNVSASSPFGPRDQAPRTFSPHDAKSLCEAASACASLRCLDLAGCDLSGPAGASAAAAAVSCLTRNNDDHGGYGCGYGIPVAGGLDRLSLRACGLGASGLAAVMRALVALPGDHDGPGTRREGPRPRFPRLLDLSDNRPLVAGGGAGGAPAVDGARRDQDRDRDAGVAGAGQAAGLEDGSDAAMSEVAASARALHVERLASVVVSSAPRRPPTRHQTSIGQEPALIDLSGNRLVFDAWNA